MLRIRGDPPGSYQRHPGPEAPSRREEPLDRDIITVDEPNILGTAVFASYVGGRTVYERR